MKKTLLLTLAIAVMVLISSGTAIADTTVWEIGVFDDLYGVTDGTKITTSPDRSVAPTGTTTVDYTDVSTFYSVLVPVTTITGTFDADLSQGATLLVSWSPGASGTEKFSVKLDGTTMSSKTVPGLVCDSSTTFPYPDGRCGEVPAYYSGYSGLPYYTEIFDFGSVGSGTETHTLSISYTVGNGMGFDYLRLSLADSDNDGIPDTEDMCSDTAVDVPEKRLGTNRWIWNEEEWETNEPEGEGPQKEFTMVDTRGCSCSQILDTMGGKMMGHRKFGCSISVMEDFIASMQPVFVETVEVYANDPNPTYSYIALESGVQYELEAMGTAFAGDTIDFDAKYSITNRISGDTWTDSVSGYESHGPGLLDLKVNGGFVDWGAYNPEHTYYWTVTGTGAPVELLIYDIYYPNNTGFITVNIYRLP